MKRLDIEICGTCHRIYCYSYETTDYHDRCLHHMGSTMNMIKEGENKMSERFKSSLFYAQLQN